MRLRVPSIHLLLTAALLLLAVALRIVDPEPVARLRLSVFDSYLNVAPRPLDETLPVRIVDIDEPSLAKVGQWPWPRTKLAAIIDALKAAGARTITLDLILAEPDRLSPGEFAKLFGDVPQLAPMIAEALVAPLQRRPPRGSDRRRSRHSRHRRRGRRLAQGLTAARALCLRGR